MSTVALPRQRTAVHTHGNRWVWIAGAAALIIVAIYAAALVWGNEVLRQRVEYNANQRLQGYKVRIPELYFHLIGCSLTLRNLEIIQQKNPHPPVAQIASLKTSVHWRALLHGRLVADFVFDEPRMHIDLAQLRSEAADKKKLHEKGWQEAAEAVYPLKINRLQIRDGHITYVDRDAKRPLQLDHLNILAENIRNVRSPDDVYPSTVHIDTTVFKTGKLRVDGHANFLSEPQASMNVDVDIADIPLKDIDPAASHANLSIRNGILNATGHLESNPKTEHIRLAKATIRKLDVDYQHRSQTEEAEAVRVERVEAAAKEASNKPSALLEVDDLEIHDGTIGYTDSTRAPGYHVFLGNTDLTIRHLTNQATQQPADIHIAGRFMGSGKTEVTSTFRPVNKTPQFDLSLAIQDAALPSLNDVFRTYGNFDVTEGQFSFFSELHAADGAIHGYVKPLFSNMKVYDRAQDRDKPLFHQLYEAIIGGVATLLENSRDDVATKAEVAGRIDNPNVRTWQAILNFLRNAFVQAIRPGLDAQLPKSSRRDQQ